MESVFAKYEAKNWPYRFKVTLHFHDVVGGIPTDQRVAEAWLRTKFEEPDDLIRAKAAEIMVEREVSLADATEALIHDSHLNGFRRDPERDGELWIGGYQVKAALKEAASVAVNAGRLPAKNWGKPDDLKFRKLIKGWFPEHVFVVENKIHLGVTEPSAVQQRFVHVGRQSGIQYEEILFDVEASFTVETDWDFPEAQWAAIWTSAERLGIGATRSLGHGTFTVVGWDADGDR